jgi:hypothetical protein
MDFAEAVYIECGESVFSAAHLHKTFNISQFSQVLSIGTQVHRMSSVVTHLEGGFVVTVGSIDGISL